MKRALFLALALAFFVNSLAQTPLHYAVFDGRGQRVDFSRVAADALKSDVVFFGELHDNAVAHALELELAQQLLSQHGQNLIFGAEMFESDNQILLNEVTQGLITIKNFDDQARLWPNYKTDYRPLLLLAVKGKNRFVATNIPRRYASVVSMGDFKALDAFGPDSKQYIVPLPIEFDAEVPCYKNISHSAMGGVGGPKYLAQAQAIKDATMAYNIAKNLSVGKKMIHFNGSYHSDNHEGILWYLKKLKPNASTMVISTVVQPQSDSLQMENLGIADFIIVTPEKVAKPQ